MRIDQKDCFVSVVIPCLNEAGAIAAVVKEVMKEGVDQVVVVDNGSTDATSQNAKDAGALVISEPQRGYGRACAAGARAVDAKTEVICFLDGDGSDVPAFFPAVIGPVAEGRADFVMGSRLLGNREVGSMTPQQVLAGFLAGKLMHAAYGVRFTDMSPFRAIAPRTLAALHMSEMTYGWNLEMQMKVAAFGYRVLEVPVDHRCRQAGVSKVSGNLVAGLNAAWKITTTFLRLATSLKTHPTADLSIKS